MCILMRGIYCDRKSNVISYCRKNHALDLGVNVENLNDYEKLDRVKRLFENEKYQEVIHQLRRPQCKDANLTYIMYLWMALAYTFYFEQQPFDDDLVNLRKAIDICHHHAFDNNIIA